ncbi:interleukin-1 receptor-associated kinase 1-binding protein 1 homolog [Physella acuta]|uniref:interleukin-1 receptor-associated kinase 1-binding protein 1 homolog n=1 Tax=Physella acuta TaxID=109671 RepID=UPI0027DDA5D3|nr:interleukin-1 receptor-associated kinase 1-binding protein 1 homolog [Physella acuta]
MAYSRPIRVFTELQSKTSNPENIRLSKSISNENSENAILNHAGYLDRQIHVTGIGELILPPDRFSINIRCKSTKATAQEAKDSINRRVDYIIQTLQNNSVKQDDFRIFQHTSHVDSMVNVDCEIEVHFTDINKCQVVSNYLSEKLGPAVSVTLPHCYHAHGSLDKLRKQVGMLAIHNARQKALEMAKVLHVTVGSALEVQELGTTESQGTQSSNTARSETSPDINPSIQQKVSDATIIIVSKVSVCFQLKVDRSKKI